MKVCSNCKTSEKVEVRKVGESYQTRDPRESSSYPRSIDMCGPCWTALYGDDFQTLNDRFRPYPI